VSRPEIPHTTLTSQAFLAGLTRAASGAAPGAEEAGAEKLSLEPIESVPVPSVAPPEAKSDYADRRARLPKITF
jgi:hypothetical protein